MEVEHENAYVPVKLLIYDVLRLRRSFVHPDYYQFCKQEIRAVDIMGVVIESRKCKDFFIYKVDDGSGVIVCIHNYFGPKLSELHEEMTCLQKSILPQGLHRDHEIDVALHHILKESQQKLAVKSEPLQQGDCAHIQGFIQDFHGNREIRVFQICKTSSFEDEIDRAHEVATIYSRLYEKIDVNGDLAVLHEK